MTSNPMHGPLESGGLHGSTQKRVSIREGWNGRTGYSYVDMAVECTVLRTTYKVSGLQKRERERETVMAAKRGWQRTGCKTNNKSRE